MDAVAASADGRTIAFEAPLGAPLPPGGFAMLGTDPPQLALVTECDMAARETGDRRAYVLRGSARVLAGGGSGGFAAVPIEAAPEAAVTAWASTALPSGGLDVGALAHAPAARALLDPHGLARHTFLVGQSGSGKTFTTGVLLEQIVRGTDLRLIILDPNSDHVGLRDTRDETDAAVAERHRENAAQLEIARSDASLPFTTIPIGMRFSNFGAAGQLLVLRLDPIAEPAEAGALLDITESLQPPYDPGDVAAAAIALGSDAGDRLAARIHALGIASWSIWQRDPTAPVLGDVLRAGRSIVIDTGSVAVPEERAALAAAALTGVWMQRAERIPTLVVLDEAHHICPAEPTDPIQRLATDLAILIAGEGRKYGIFLLLATQRPQKVHQSVVAGCESLVLLRMNSLRDVEELAATFSYVPEGLLRLAPGFARGEALIAGALAPVPLHVRIGGRITLEGGGDVPGTWVREADTAPA
jgi:DNA helicase HerA-like ATPase